MRWSLGASLAIHAAILLAAVIVLPEPERHKVEMQESIPVDIVSIEDVSLRQATSKTAPELKPEEKPAPQPAPPKPEAQPEPQPAPEPKMAAKEPEPPDSKPLEELIQKTEPPKPEPKAEKPPDPEPLEQLLKETEKLAPKVEEKPPEPKKPEVKKAEAKPEKKPDKKPEKKKPKLDLSQVSALLNKIDGAPSRPRKNETQTGTPKRGAFDSGGLDQRLAATLLDAMRQKIESCWTIPAGAREAEQLLIKLEIKLNQDGSLAAYPILLNSSSHPAFDAAARAAQAAVEACSPYDFLPQDKYAMWQDIILNFDPSQMLATN
jgi:outer membrane biosynthesis protein TonB